MLIIQGNHNGVLWNILEIEGYPKDPGPYSTMLAEFYIFQPGYILSSC